MASRSVALLLLGAPAVLCFDSDAAKGLKAFGKPASKKGNTDAAPAAADAAGIPVKAKPSEQLQTLLALVRPSKEMIAEPPSLPLYDCVTSYQTGLLGEPATGSEFWTPDWKEYCCEHANRGCETRKSIADLAKEKHQARKAERDLHKQKKTMEESVTETLGKFGEIILEDIETDKAEAEAEEKAAKEEAKKKEAAQQKLEEAKATALARFGPNEKEEPKRKEEPKKKEPKKKEPKKKEPKRKEGPKRKQEPKKKEPRKQEPKKKEPKKTVKKEFKKRDLEEVDVAAAQQKFLSGPAGAPAAAGSWALGAFVLGSAVVGFSAILVSTLRRTRPQRFEHLAVEGQDDALDGDLLERAPVVE